MPSRNALKQLVKRCRKLEGQAPPVPTTLEQLVIPERYQRYEVSEASSEKFLLADSGPQPGRILIFGRESICSLLVSGIWMGHSALRQIYFIRFLSSW